MHLFIFFTKNSFIIFICLFIFNACTSKSKDTKSPLKPSYNFVFPNKRFDTPEINNIAITAWKNFHKKQFEQAALDFERLYNKDFVHYDSTFGAGISFMKFYNLKKALKFFTLTIDKFPEHFEARYHRALLNIEIKNFSEARKDLESLLAIKDTSFFICGLHPQDKVNDEILKKRQKKALTLLKSL